MHECVINIMNTNFLYKRIVRECYCKKYGSEVLPWGGGGVHATITDLYKAVIMKTHFYFFSRFHSILSKIQGRTTFDFRRYSVSRHCVEMTPVLEMKAAGSTELF